ncbi:MAG: SusF/SusE family outer membrane protein [Salinivirgaceae bacterium]|nr:SusF/SusE family outer membrane protein [Salinivirgaceae bacterium]
MKKNFLRLFAIAIIGAISFTACDKDDDGPTITPTPTDTTGVSVNLPDGYYVFNGGTTIENITADGLMKVTRNEVIQEDRDDLLEVFFPVSAADGFYLMEIKNKKPTMIAAGADFAKIAEPDTEAPQDGLWRGAFVEDSSAFTVEEDGLYHIMIDLEVEKIAIAYVKTWGVIGAATPGGWTTDTELALEAFDMNTLVFKATEIEMSKADFKFRYSGGWKVIIDSEYAADPEDATKLGIKVNTNFGGTLEALVPGGDNIANETPGIYTITMTYIVGTGYTAVLEKTGESGIIDYSATELGLIGSYIVIGEEASSGWDVTAGLTIPEANNTVYTWRWSAVEIMADSSFKIREGQTWDDISIGYGSVTMAGSLADDFGTNADGNFVPTVDGTYDFTLTIDASTETYTFTAEPSGTPVPDHIWGVIGSSVVPYDWTVDVDMTWEHTTNIWSVTLDMVAGEWKFRADDDWALAYGVDGDGNLTSEGGATNMAVTEDGNYTIELILTDAENPTYTIVKN